MIRIMIVNSTSLDFFETVFTIGVMKTEINLHPAQIGILLVLLFKKRTKFSELNTTGLSNDHLTFHIKTLLKEKLIKKNKSFYLLTANGKEFANRFDTENKKVERQAKVAILLHCQKSTKEGLKYLVQQRLKEPYYGFYGFFGGKVRWGETLHEAAKRELLEETGLTGKLDLVRVKHKMDYDKGGNLLEDKLFFIFNGKNLKGKLIKNFEGGRNLWLSEAEILSLSDLFDGVKETMKFTGGEKITFIERKYKVKRY
jgi:8-oxo-dGTP pyrophosphatase MutT (NUDIX family)